MPAASEKDWIPRQQVLTQKDLEVLAGMLQQHQCRFENITADDMTLIKDLLQIYKEGRSELIKYAVKGLLYMILLTIAAIAYFKMGVHK